MMLGSKYLLTPTSCNNENKLNCEVTMSEKKQDVNIKSSDKTRKFQANNKYFTIAVYSIGVIFIGAIIIKLFLSWEESIATFRTIINILMPFFLGALIAYILNPAVKRIRRFLQKVCKLKKNTPLTVLSIAITYLLVLGFIIFALFGIIPQIIESIIELVNYIPKAANIIYEFFDNIEENFPNLDMEVLRTTINNALPDFINYLKDFAANMVPALFSVSMSIVQWIVNLLVVIMVSIYILADKKSLLNTFRGIIYAFVPVNHINSTIGILKEGNSIFGGFFIGKSIDSLIIGILCFIIMSILQLPYAVLISTIVGVTNMIPYFGPFIGAIPGVLILLLVSPLKALIFTIMILVLQQFDGLILGPKILGNSTGLKPLWIIIAITVGGSVAGVLGMLLGVPVVAFLRYLLNCYISYRLEIRKNKDSANFKPE